MVQNIDDVLQRGVVMSELDRKANDLSVRARYLIYMLLILMNVELQDSFGNPLSISQPIQKRSNISQRHVLGCHWGWFVCSFHSVLFLVQIPSMRVKRKSHSAFRSKTTVSNMVTLVIS